MSAKCIDGRFAQPRDRDKLTSMIRETAMPEPGLIVAPLTPFTADLTVDEPALARQIDYIIKD